MFVKRVNGGYFLAIYRLCLTHYIFFRVNQDAVKVARFRTSTRQFAGYIFGSCSSFVSVITFFILCPFLSGSSLAITVIRGLIRCLVMEVL